MSRHHIFLVGLLSVVLFAFAYANNIHEDLFILIQQQNKVDNAEENEVNLEENQVDDSQNQENDNDTEVDDNDTEIDNNDAEVNENDTETNDNDTEIDDTETEETDNTERSIPAQANLDIPFYAQAPDGDWSLPWKEACEEASLILASAFLEGENLSKAVFKERILTLVEMQQEMFGQYIDTSIADTDQLYKTFKPGGETLIIDNPTIEDLQYHIAQGHPIVAPFAGKELENPHYANGWPWYHMLVIRWYDQQYFYTNDVGTSRGDNFPYTHENLMESLHDLVPDRNISAGEKRVLVIIK